MRKDTGNLLKIEGDHGGSELEDASSNSEVVGILPLVNGSMSYGTSSYR